VDAIRMKAESTLRDKQRSTRPAALVWSAAARAVNVVCANVIELSDGGGDVFDQIGLTVQPSHGQESWIVQAPEVPASSACVSSSVPTVDRR
jgi:hypothetical protein